MHSPQRYFQENQAGSLTIDCKLACLTLSDGSIMKFSYNVGSHLPLMLPSDSYGVGMSYEDCLTLSDPKLASSYLNVADETNQNLTGSQKELLLWHWRLSHANMSWIERLLATRNETNLQQDIIPKLAGASSCTAPLCATCQFVKQHRKGPGTSIEIRPLQNLQLLKSNHLQPGDKTSIDQYLSTVPGQIEHTK